MDYKKVFSTLTFATLMTSSFAFDWGGLVSAKEKFINAPKENITNFDKSTAETVGEAYIWLKLPFSEDGENYLTTEGTYNFDYTYTNSEGDCTQYIDLDLFKVVFAPKLNESTSMNISIGRFNYSDLSGLIFTQNADGVLIKLNESRFGLSTYASYTGLLNGRAVSMISVDNPNDKDVYIEDTEKFYDFAEKYVIGSLSLSLPNIFLNQSINIEGLGTFRVAEKKYNRFYGTVAVSGPIISEMFYTLSSSIGYAKYDKADEKIGVLSQLSCTYFSSFKDSAIGVSSTFASKDFIGFSSQTAVNSQSGGEYNGILKAGLFYSIKPISNILISLSSDGIFDFKNGNNNDKFGYTGFQMQGNAGFQIFSDLNLNLSAIQYIDKDDSSENKTTLELKAVITF